MKWTKELPTKPGWYWAKQYADVKTIVQVADYDGELCVKVGNVNIGVNRIAVPCEWAGPIKEPK